MTNAEWVRLREAARAVLPHAYAPYSGFPVAAAASTADGRTLVGVNVENASFGLTLCAECAVVSALHCGGGGRLVALTCLGPDGEVLTPCGRCRQLLFEHGGPSLLVDDPTGPRPLADLLPGAFGPADLDRGEGSPR